jgi:hypothetical protein
MLHIVTPLYRPENLEQIYESIPKNDDIMWHISKSNKTNKLEYSFLEDNDNIKIYEVDCDDKERWTKRNFVFENLNEGYFCCLDDDTIFNIGMYKEYLKISEENFKGIIVGQQITKSGDLRLKQSIPRSSMIDTGNVFSHVECLKTVKWPKYEDYKNLSLDYYFWLNVYKFFNKQIILIPTFISNYNFLNPKEDQLMIRRNKSQNRIANTQHIVRKHKNHRK